MKNNDTTRRRASLLGTMIAATLLGATLVPIAPAQTTVYWDGNGTASGFQLVNGDFGTSTFWNPSNTGIGTLATWVTGNDAAFTYNGTNSLTINSTATARDFLMANQNTNGISVTLNLSGSNTLSVTRNFGLGWSTNGNASIATAVLNQSGGTISGATFTVGRNGANGTWTLSGGSANGTSLVMATDVFGTTTGSVAPVGTVTISGGNMTLSGAISMGRGVAGAIAQATLNVNSGSLTAGTMNIGVGDFSNSTVNLNGGTLTITNTASPGTSTNKTATFRFNGGTLRSAANNGAFVANLSNAYVDSGGAFIDIDGKTSTISQALLQGTGNGGLTLSSSAGNGTLTLSGNNTYTGATTINSGTLLLASTGSIASSSTINVASGATFNVAAVSGFAIGTGQTLKGSGTVTGNTTINGSLQPGASPGVLTMNGTLTLASSAVTTMELNGTNRGTQYDGIDMGLNSLAYGGNLTITLGATFSPGNYTFDLFNFSGTQTGSFANVTLVGNYAGSLTNNSGVWSLTSGNETWTFAQNTGDLSLEVIPEPATWALLAGSLTVLAFLRRRRIN